MVGAVAGLAVATAANAHAEERSQRDEALEEANRIEREKIRIEKEKIRAEEERQAKILAERNAAIAAEKKRQEKAAWDAMTPKQREDIAIKKLWISSCKEWTCLN